MFPKNEILLRSGRDSTAFFKRLPVKWGKIPNTKKLRTLARQNHIQFAVLSNELFSFMVINYAHRSSGQSTADTNGSCPSSGMFLCIFLQVHVKLFVNIPSRPISSVTSKNSNEIKTTKEKLIIFT